jgi:hypothetical protein
MNKKFSLIKSEHTYSYIVISILIIVFIGKKIFPLDGNFIGGYDVKNFYFWYYLLTKNQFLSGNIPLWNPYACSGIPFFPNSNFYPPTFFFVFLPLHYAFNIDTIFHLFFAAIGIYYYIYLITDHKIAALSSAIVYSLSGYTVDRLLAGHISYLHSVALLPWLFYFIENSYQNKKNIYLLFSGILLGTNILSGDTQNSYYFALFLSLYYFIRYFPISKEQINPTYFYATIRGYLTIPIVSFLTSAVQIFPTVEMMKLSARSENTYDFATNYSFPLKNFFTFLIPSSYTQETFWEFTGYFGVSSVILAFLGIFFFQNKRLKVCLLIMVILSITIMIGNNSPVYKLYYKFLPGLSIFRAPCRCVLMFVFFMSIFVGLGIQSIQNVNIRKYYHIINVCIIILFLSLIVAGVAIYELPIKSNDIIFAGIQLFILFTLLTILPYVKKKNVITGFIFIILFGDLYLLYAPAIPQININDVSKLSHIEKAFDKDDNFYRVNLPVHLKNIHYGGLRGIKHKYFDVNGYAYVMLNDYVNFIYKMADISKGEDTGKHWLDLSLFKDNRVFSSKILNIKYALIKNQNENSYSLAFTNNFMPRAALISDAIFLPNLDDHIVHLKKPDFDPRKQVLLLSSDEKYKIIDENNELTDKNINSVVIDNYSPNRIELTSISQTAAYLVLSEIFYPGWSAYIDAEKVQILRADYLIRAIPIPSGSHNIVFKFEPISFISGFVITFFVFPLSLIIIFLIKKNRSYLKKKL